MDQERHNNFRSSVQYKAGLATCELYAQRIYQCIAPKANVILIQHASQILQTKFNIILKGTGK